MRLLVATIFFLRTITGFTQLSVSHLQIENRINPLGVDNIKPTFRWQLENNQRNVLQTAYQVLVSNDENLLQKDIGNIWDSKKIPANTSIQVEYKGKQLSSTKKYFWKVKVWDNKGSVSNWSSSSYWQMGLLKKKDWMNAKWVAYEEIPDSLLIAPHIHLNGKRSWGARRNILPLIRKEFSVRKEVKQATVFVCGLGHFNLSMNGMKVGTNFLDPGWTNYNKHALYVSFNVTDNLTKGLNAIGVSLGNGFYYIPGQRYRKMTGAYGMPKMILRLMIEYADGTTDNIISDETWKTSPSPVIFSSIFGGEDYDANLVQEGWSTAGFDDSKWKSVLITAGSPLLESQMAEPLGISSYFKPVSSTKIAQNIFVYDLGQNFSGVPSISVRGNKYDTVRIYCGEIINADGTVNQKATGSPSFFTYILGDSKGGSWYPQFTYTGFRYMQVYCIAKDSLKPPPEILQAEGLHVRNRMGKGGSFKCSNELFNRTYDLIDWAIKSNTMSVFTDCPHREKLGWLEETHLMGASVQYNYDVAALCKKVIKDMMNAQHPDGKIPEIAPEFTAFTPPFDESPEWGSAAIILPWYNYQWYGDKQSLIDAYSMMKGYIMYLKNKATGNILSHGLGDWYDIGPNRPGVSQMTKKGVTGTATYHYDLTIMHKVAKLLNKIADVKMYQELAAQVKRSFNDKFFDEQKLQYDSASQTANAMALYMGLVEPQNKTAVIDALIKDIRSRNNALTAGDIGYRYVLRALEDAGRNDIIFEMNSREDVPGYGYQLKHGATALTESWQAYESVSNNHFMLGHLMEWFYGGLAGIKQPSSSVAYKAIEIKPEPVGDVNAAKATYQSPYGLIVSDWKKQGSRFELNVTIPVNTTAVIYLPAQKLSEIKETGKKWSNVLYQNNKAIIKLGSGNYHFSVQ